MNNKSARFSHKRKALIRAFAVTVCLAFIAGANPPTSVAAGHSVNNTVTSTALQNGIVEAVVNPNVKLRSARASSCLTYGADYRVTFTISVRNTGATKSQKIYIRVQSADGGRIVQWNDIANVHAATDNGGGLWPETQVTGEIVGPKATKTFKFSVDFYYNPNRVNLEVFNGKPSYGLLVSGYFAERAWQTSSSYNTFC